MMKVITLQNGHPASSVDIPLALPPRSSPISYAGSSPVRSGSGVRSGGRIRLGGSGSRRKSRRRSRQGRPRRFGPVRTRTYDRCRTRRLKPGGYERHPKPPHRSYIPHSRTGSPPTPRSSRPGPTVQVNRLALPPRRRRSSGSKAYRNRSRILQFQLQVVKPCETRPRDIPHFMIGHQEPFFPPHKHERSLPLRRSGRGSVRGRRDHPLLLAHRQPRPSQFVPDLVKPIEPAPMPQIVLFRRLGVVPRPRQKPILFPYNLPREKGRQLGVRIRQVRDGEIAREGGHGEIHIEDPDFHLVTRPPRRLFPPEDAPRVERSTALRRTSQSPDIKQRVG